MGKAGWKQPRKDVKSKVETSEYYDTVLLGIFLFYNRDLARPVLASELNSYMKNTRYSRIVNYAANQNQLFVFIAIGFLLLAIDTSIFLALTFSPISTININLLSKGGAAVFGYFLHRKYTFTEASEWHNLGQIIRYLLYLILMILISTALIAFSEYLIEGFRDNFLVTFAVKVLVECICVVISFLISRFWVYK